MSIFVFTKSGERYSLDANDAIGSGGEGSVYPYPGRPKEVIKIYENPDSRLDKLVRPPGMGSLLE